MNVLRGILLIPAFAVGRTQEIIYLIRELEEEKRIPVLPVIVDSPMAAAATQAYSRRTEEQDEDYASVLARHRQPLRTASMVTSTSREESKRHPVASIPQREKMTRVAAVRPDVRQSIPGSGE